MFNVSTTMISDPRHIRISDYQYELPDERIAKFPKARRDQSKLLIYNKGEVGEDGFSLVAEGDIFTYDLCHSVFSFLYFSPFSFAHAEQTP